MFPRRSRFARIVTCVLSIAGVAASLFAQTSTQIRDTGPRANRINVVFVAEGYTAAEEAKFGTDAANLLQGLLADESWSRFANSVNAFAIYVASAESGADDPATSTVRDTYFNSAFGTSGIDRLLTINGNAYTKMQTLLTQFVPDWDVVVVLVNSTKYGGSGGTYSVISLHSSSLEIMLHEVGHSFANLADEYIDDTLGSSPSTVESPNATTHSTRETAPWKTFIALNTPIPTTSAPNENTVGLFLGSYYRSTGYYRPTNNSKMRALGRPFGPVNLRAFATEVHRLNLNLATATPTITQQPVGATVASGASRTLSVQASGVGPLTYQWRHDDIYLPTGTAADFTISGMNAAQAGHYAVEVTNARGTVTSAEVLVQLTTSPPVIQAVSPNVSVSSGGSTTLSVTATGPGTLTYQWSRNGVAISGATSSSLALTSLQSADAGSYTVTVRDSGGGSATATVQVSIAGYARIFALSVRANASTGDRTLIVGLVTSSGVSKSLLLRAVGPTLVNQNVAGFLADPKLQLFSLDRVELAQNNDWQGNAAIASAAAQVGLFPLPADSKDAALLRSLASGVYTAHASADAGSGIVLVEAYDTDAGSPAARLTAVSARNFVGTGDDLLVAGIAISGAGSRTLIIRGLGPALTASGVSGVLADPRLQVFQSSTQIQENDDWGGATAISSAAAQIGLAPITATSKDAALLVTLPPGVYTVHLSGVGNTTGIGLIEIYEAP